MTAPLAPIKDSLVLVEKLSSNGTSDNHAAPGGLTGLGYSSNKHISLDQYVADALRAPHWNAQALGDHLPTRYDWPLFAFALALMCVPLADLVRQLRRR